GPADRAGQAVHTSDRGGEEHDDHEREDCAIDDPEVVGKRPRHASSLAPRAVGSAQEFGKLAFFTRSYSSFAAFTTSSCPFFSVPFSAERSTIWRTGPLTKLTTQRSTVGPFGVEAPTTRSTPVEPGTPSTANSLIRVL